MCNLKYRFLPAKVWLVDRGDAPMHLPSKHSWRKCVLWWLRHRSVPSRDAVTPVASSDDELDRGHRVSGRRANWFFPSEWFRSFSCGFRRWMEAANKLILIHVLVFFILNLCAIQLTNPVNMSYMRAPSDHQSTALPWPLLVKISGALCWTTKNYVFKIKPIKCNRKIKAAKR